MVASPVPTGKSLSPIEQILGGRAVLKPLQDIVEAAADETFVDMRLSKYGRLVAESMQARVHISLRDRSLQLGFVHEPANNQLRVISHHKDFRESVRLRWCLGRRIGESDTILLRAGKGPETSRGVIQNAQQYRQLTLFDRNTLLSPMSRACNLWLIYNVMPQHIEAWLALVHKMPSRRVLKCLDVLEICNKPRGSTVNLPERTSSGSSSQPKIDISERTG